MEGTPYAYTVPIVVADIDGDSDGASFNYTLIHSTTNTVCGLGDNSSACSRVIFTTLLLILVQCRDGSCIGAVGYIL